MFQQFVTEVASNLWIGSYPIDTLMPIDKLIVCSQEPLPLVPAPDGVLQIYAPLSPDLTAPNDFALAVQTGRAVAGYLRRKQRVLVACSTGRNRSALVAAISLMTYGLPALKAMNTIRSAAPDALQEPHVLPILSRLEDARDLRIHSSV